MLGEGRKGIEQQIVVNNFDKQSVTLRRRSEGRCGSHIWCFKAALPSLIYGPIRVLDEVYLVNSITENNKAFRVQAFVDYCQVVLQILMTASTELLPCWLTLK